MSLSYRFWKVLVPLCVTASTSFHRAPPSSTVLQSREIILATTTSTRDAGLLDSLLPFFERETGYQVKVIAVGSGQALALGRRGDADVVLSHAPEAERVLADSGYLLRRRLVMHNDFLIVGPASDPAGLRGLTDAVAAMRRVAAAGARFVSRGDRSGTNLLELKLWKLAAIEPPATTGEGGWYLDAGQGMAATLQMADEKRAYTITDRATYLAWRDRVQLVPLAGGDPVLYNVYHVMEVNPRNAPRVNARGARTLADWFIAPATQRLIGAFGTSRFGQSLFAPDAGKPDRW
jgi:tungstate transport system substrate-binding protein